MHSQAYLYTYKRMHSQAYLYTYKRMPYKPQITPDNLSYKPHITQLAIEDMLPRRICERAELLDEHVEYWLKNMPDMSDLAVIQHGQLQFWTKQKKKDRTKSHRWLKGLKASWTNASVDFVISQNKWPVIFTNRDGHVVDLVDEVVLIFWVSYVRHMVRILPYMIFLTTSKTTPSGANDGTKQQPHQHHPILCKHHQAKKVVSSYTYISYGTNNLINTTRSCVVGGVCKHRATGVCKHHQAKKVVSSFTYICHLYTYKRMHLQTLFIHL